MANKETSLDSPRETRFGKGFRVPLSFLGLGVYRAWIEITYTNPPQISPIDQAMGANIQDVLLAVCLLALALAHRLLTPLADRKLLVWAGAAAMSLSTVLEFWSIVDPSTTAFMAPPAAILSSIGLAILILLWCELYACLNPFRIILYFSAALILGWVIVFFLQGLAFEQLAIAAIFLPLVSTQCALRSFETIPAEGRPQRQKESRPFPWKIVLTMAAYTFAFAIFESAPSDLGGPLSSVGMLAAAAVVFVMASYFTELVKLDSLFRVTLPLMAFGLFLASHFAQGAEGASGILISASYTVFLIMLMVVMCNQARVMAISAIWLFGIERATRYIVYAVGANVEETLLFFVPAEDSIRSILGFAAIALIAVTTVVMLVDKSLLSGWTIIPDKKEQEPGIAKSEDLTAEYGLTPREQEVFSLLVKGKNVAAIERELFIANGTAKAHVQHLYKKLGVHTRKEFMEKVGALASAKDTEDRD